MPTKTTTQKIQDLKTVVDRINTHMPAITDPGTGVAYECFDFSKVVEIQSETDTSVNTHTTQLTTHQNLFNQTYVCRGSFTTALAPDAAGVFTIDTSINSTLIGKLISVAPTTPINSWKFTNVPDAANVVVKTSLMISNFITTTLSDTATIMIKDIATPVTATVKWLGNIKPSTVANEIFLIEFTLVRDDAKTITLIGKTSRTGA